MKFIDLLEELKQRDIQVSFSAGKLKYSGPKENLTPDFIKILKENKKRLIKYIWPKEPGNLMPINPVGSKTPLFVVHGDNADRFLPEFLGSDQPYYGYLHIGSDGEKIRFKNVKKMARAYLDQLFFHKPNGPYYLGGFSFGGVLAFEMAVQLMKLGHEVPFLFLIDVISPLAREPIKWGSNIYTIIRKNILGSFKRYLIRLSKRFICESFLLINVPIPIKLRNFYILDKYNLLNKKYSPEKYNGEMLLFRGTENKSSFKYLGWKTLVDKIKMVIIETDHTTIVDRKENVKIIYDELVKNWPDFKN